MDNRKNITELVFIMDRSGSMHGMEADTVGGFNSLIEKQKKEEGTAFVTTVLFNNDRTILHDRVNLKEIRPMAVSDFRVGGSTALLDTVGETIRHIDAVHRYIRPEDLPQKTIFAITTDGMENSSHHHTYDSVKAAIESHKEKGWEFIFMAANIDAGRTADMMGIERMTAVNFHNDSEGVRVRDEFLNDTINLLRKNARPTAATRARVDADYKFRK